MNEVSLKNYLDQLEDLQSVANESSKRIISDDVLFRNHANFFAKSYLITLCTILESYLKAEVIDFIEEINDIFEKLEICKNPIVWGIVSEVDDLYKKLQTKQVSEKFSLLIDGEEVDRLLSANIARTIATFRRCGMEIQECNEFRIRKDIVGSIVDKRNDIIHHNDDASDITCNDIVAWIDEVVQYIKGICKFVSGVRQHNAMHLQMLNVGVGECRAP